MIFDISLIFKLATRFSFLLVFLWFSNVAIFWIILFLSHLRNIFLCLSLLKLSTTHQEYNICLQIFFYPPKIGLIIFKTFSYFFSLLSYWFGHVRYWCSKAYSSMCYYWEFSLYNSSWIFLIYIFLNFSFLCVHSFCVSENICLGDRKCIFIIVLSFQKEIKKYYFFFCWKKYFPVFSFNFFRCIYFLFHFILCASITLGWFCHVSLLTVSRKKKKMEKEMN